MNQHPPTSFRLHKPGQRQKRPVKRVPFTRKVSQQEIHNRIKAILEHIQDYYFQGASHLARDAGISRSALSRLMSGRSSPSYALVCTLTSVLENKLGRRVDPRDIISLDGEYLTPSICELTGCKGCLPKQVSDKEGAVNPEYRHIRSGKWSLDTSAQGDRLVSIEREAEE